MKIKFTAILGTLMVLFSAISTPASAGGLGFGIQGMGTHLEGSGREILKQSNAQQSATKVQNYIIPHGFIEWEFGEGGFVIGYDRVPGSAEIAMRSITRTDITTAAGTATSITQKAQAEFDEHESIYVESPTITPLGIYLKAAYGDVRVTTGESLGTGAAYGNTNVDFISAGFGMRRVFKDHLIVKFETMFTNYGSVKLKSTGSDAASEIQGEIDTVSAGISLGYQF